MNVAFQGAVIWQRQDCNVPTEIDGHQALTLA